MNIITVIPNPFKFDDDSSDTDESGKLRSSRLLDEGDVSTSEFRRIKSRNLSKLFLNNVMVFLFITGIAIALLTICKLLKNKFEFCNDVNEKNYSYMIKL